MKTRSRVNQPVILSVAALVAIFTTRFASAIVVDGFFDPNEGYTQSQSIYFGNSMTGGLIPDPGRMYWHVDSATGDVFAAFIMPRSINDNTYGTNAIGWPASKGGTPLVTGGKHNFSDLVGSDKGQFDFYDGTGKKVLSFNLDYISATSKSPSGYDSLGVTGGDGKMLTGSASYVMEWGTSLDYNFNVLGYVLTTNSPSAQPVLDASGKIDYSQPYINVDPNYAGWVFDLVYEVKVCGEVFGPAGFGSVNFPTAHNSPSKYGQNTIPQIPEPATALIGAMLLTAVCLREFGRRG